MTPRGNTLRTQQAPARSAEVDAFGEAVLTGLSNPRKRLPCQYFYDAAGSELFEEITRLEEYYPTRAETAILHEHARSMVRPAGRRAVLVEFGSGSSRKTELVLAALEAPRAYVPIDVSQSALAEARARLERRFPGLEIVPVNASFCDALRLPARVLPLMPSSASSRAPRSATSTRRTPGCLLTHFARVLGPGSRLIVGVDLDKDPRRLESPPTTTPRASRPASILNLLEAHQSRARRRLRPGPLSAPRHLRPGTQAHRNASGQPSSPDRRGCSASHSRSRPGRASTRRTLTSIRWSSSAPSPGGAGWQPARVWLDRRPGLQRARAAAAGIVS